MSIENLGQLINHLATKAGLKSDDPNLVNILSNSELSKIKVHSELVSAIDENLLHIEAALDSHPRVRAKYTAEILNPFDTRMAAMLEEMGLDDTAKAELSGIKSTYKRFDALTAKIKGLKDSKAAATKDTDKQALQAQIDTLQTELRTAKAATDAAKTEYEQKLTTDRIDFRLGNAIAAVKTTIDGLPQEVRNDTLKNIIQKYLQANDAELRFDEKNELQPYKKDGSKLYGANHTLINLQSLIDTQLAQNKLLSVSPANSTNGANGLQNGNHQQNQQNGQSNIIDLNANNGQNKINGTNQTVANLNLDAIKAFETQDS
jgi:hypothetical protein